jgi:hypothetical protein
MDFQKELIDIGCLIWFKLGMKSWQMWKQKWTFGFHKVWGTFYLAKGKLAFEKDSAACSAFVHLFFGWMAAGKVRRVQDVYWESVVWLSTVVKDGSFLQRIPFPTIRVVYLIDIIPPTAKAHHQSTYWIFPNP